MTASKSKTHGSALKFILAGGLAAALIAAAAWLFIPTAAIVPGDAGFAVSLGSPIEIHTSSLGQITKMAVYADEQLLGMEYNLGTGDLVRDFELKPGQEVRVEAKVTSPLGITREFTSRFSTVPPIKVEAMSVDGVKYSPSQRIAPQSALTFTFSKPVTQAAVSLDGSDPIEMQVDPENPAQATLPPTMSFKQGTTHLLQISATAEDSATLAPQSLRAAVVKPLTLFGKVEESGGRVRLELDASIPFADPEQVKAALETSLTDPEISVERQKIVITCSSLDHGSEYTIRIARAEGADGSFLESPLTMKVSFKAGPASTTYAEGQSYRGYVYTPGTSGATSGGSVSGGGGGGGGASAGSGPPPGWPPCCPWPPE